MNKSTSTTTDDSEALKCIAAMLLALAVLAERAAGRSWAVRCLVLWILRPAEAVMREFLVEAWHDLGAPANLAAYSLESPALTVLRPRGESSDAVRLAVAFRALAAAFDDLAALALVRWRTPFHADLGRLLSLLEPGHACGRLFVSPRRVHQFDEVLKALRSFANGALKSPDTS